MTKVVILDVGHGNCAVVQDGKRCLVVDAGPGTALLEFIREAEIDVVEEMLISHADTDHLKGVQTLLDQDVISVRSVRVNSDAAKNTVQWDGMLRSLDDRNRRGTIRFAVQLMEGDQITFCDTVVEVLAPSGYLAGKGPGSRDPTGRRITTNTVSAVVRVRMPDQSVLFTGDLDEVGLKLLTETDQDLQADVLVFPHHGGHVSNSATPARNRRFAERLLSAVSPKIVVFSLSRVKYSNPRHEIIEAVRTNPLRKVMCTQMSQNCLDEAPNDDEHLANVFADGRRSGHCCAGTIVIAGSTLYPSVSSHTDFVRGRAPNALCRPLTLGSEELRKDALLPEQ